jgi:hypothetical protein
MKSAPFFLILLHVALLNGKAFAQKQKLDIRVISTLRVTPIYTSFNDEPLVPDPPVLLQQDAHLSGFSLGAGMHYKLNEKFYISYTFSGRADQFYTDLQTIELKRRFFIDHSFGAGRLLGRKKKFSVGAEVSFRNRNSEFSIKRTGPGNPPYILSTYDFNFTTLDLPFLYRHKQFFIGITPTYSLQHKFHQKSPFIQLMLHAGISFPVRDKEQ